MAIPKFTTEEILEVDADCHQKPARTKERLEMVSSQIEARGIRSPRVLEAMRKVERHRFIPPDGQAFAYRDGPVAIGQGQTISQPYIVTAAPARLPKVLLDQLKPGGRWRQELVLIRHTPDGCRRERLMPVHFAPIVKQLNLD